MQKQSRADSPWLGLAYTCLLLQENVLTRLRTGLQYIYTVNKFGALKFLIPGQGPLGPHNYSCTTNPFEMAEQPPPPYPGTDSEKTLLPGEVEFPSAPPPGTQYAYPPPSSAAPVQPPYPPSAQPAPYPYPSQPYPPPAAARRPPPAGTGYPASAPPVSVSPAVSYSE